MSYNSSVRIVMQSSAWNTFNRFVEKYLTEHVPKDKNPEDYNIINEADVKYIGKDEVYIGWTWVRWYENSDVYGVDAVMYAIDKLCDADYAVAYARVGEDSTDVEQWNHEGETGDVEVPTPDITFNDDYFTSDPKGVRQVKIKDLDNNEIHGAIMLPSGDAVCGCCGSVLPADECLNSPLSRGPEEATWEILEDDLSWIDLDEAILGDDNEE